MSQAEMIAASEGQEAETRHPALSSYAVRNGCLLIGETPVTQLAERIGRTPFYAYDRAKLDTRIALLRKHLPMAIALHYAVKANPMPAVVQHLRGLVDGFDIASPLEMQVALDSGMSARHISFAGPGKQPWELRQAVAAGVLVEVESETEVSRLAEVGEALGIRPRVAIRINPDFQLKASGMRMGGGAQQFGVDAERVPQLLGELRGLDLCFEGFHVFAGSQNLHAELIVETQEKTVELLLRLAQHCPAEVTHVNLGGGFGIPYFPNDKPLELARVSEALAELLPRLTSEMPKARPIIELGRFIVGEAGVYICRVVDRKVSRGEVFLVTDGGLHHHLAASGNFGQRIRRNYPVAVATKMDAPSEETASVVGPLCTPLDLLADKMTLPRAEVGDLIVVFQSGAYGLTASPTGFLSHPQPAEALV